MRLSESPSGLPSSTASTLNSFQSEPAAASA